MPRVNLLPWREADRKRRRQEFMFSIVAAIGSAALVTLAGRGLMASAISHQETRNRALETQITALEKQIEEINGLEKQKQALIARMEIIETLQRSRPEIVHVFDQLVRTIPDGVSLTGLKQTDRKLQLKGLAQSSTRVASYMRNIDASEWLTDPSLDILETKGSGDTGSEFTLNAQQENPQLATNPDQQVAAAPPKGPAGARQ